MHITGKRDDTIAILKLNAKTFVDPIYFTLLEDVACLEIQEYKVMHYADDTILILSNFM